MAWQRKIPFGYSVQNGKIVINHGEATVVQTIYAMYRSGSSYSRIAAEMERQGICYCNFDFGNKKGRSAIKAKRSFEQYSVPPVAGDSREAAQGAVSPLFGAQRRKCPRHSGIGGIASQSARYMAAGHV